MIKLIYKSILGMMAFVILIFLFNQTARAQNICGDYLTIDVFDYEWWVSPGNTPWGACRNVLVYPPTGDHDEPCSPTNGDCKTDRAVCADVSPRSCTSGGYTTAPCTNISNNFCIRAIERAECQAGTRYTCVDGTYIGNASCTKQRYDCWINWDPTPTSVPPPPPTPPPGPCDGMTAPYNPSVTNLTPTSATLNWNPGSGGTTQLLRLGPNRTEVQTGCPGGVGPGLGCLYGQSVVYGSSTFNVSGLTQSTTYYWRIVEYKNSNGAYLDFGNSCNTASSVSFNTPIPSCTLSFSPSPVNVAVGGTANVVANVVPVGGTIDRVEFAIEEPAIAAIEDPPGPPYNDLTNPYIARVRGVSVGDTVLTASVYMGGVLGCGGLAPIDPINVSDANAWWQVKDGDVIVNADIISPIPATCSLPVCDPAFVVTPTGVVGSGIPSYAGGLFDVSAGVPPGTVSSTGWLAQASYSAQTDYNYAFFERLVPGDTVRNTIATPVIAPNALKDIWETNYPNNLSPDGYVWAFRNGDLTMRGELTLGARKIVLFVDGNLTIGDGTTTGNIDITPGTGFFMAVVSGNIIVHQEVRNPPGPASPELEGIFVANGNFTTASGGPATDDPIQIRGMVAAYGQVDPNRDLPDNSRTPAELFEYAPDLLFNMPPSLQLKRTRWKEVAP